MVELHGYPRLRRRGVTTVKPWEPTEPEAAVAPVDDSSALRTL